MRKFMFVSFFSAMCIVAFDAFCATTPRTAPNARRVATTDIQETKQPTPVQARSATVARGVTKPITNQQTTARAATVNRGQSVPASKNVTARAATQQKAINLGTKVDVATANTVVPQECQDAYNGCMDSFCMLDNASGGRCQCSDRHLELDAVLEDIMKLDEQSLAMATEGVERLQMGENAEEIMARAKAAADMVVGSGKTDDANGAKTVRTLDLSGWRDGNLFDDATEDFVDTSLFATEQSTLTNKTGDALQREVSKMCAERVPNQCKNSVSFLQLAYAQKIKSDCTAYENSLKQQRNQSAEKLQTAQKALRDAALEMYQNENKYDFGQCVVQFKRCLQTTGECGDDYSGCVADNAILGQLYGKKSGHTNVATTVIKTGSTSVTISAASYDILNTKKVMCESVTKQCVNANKRDAVWSQVIKDLAPIVYTAEYNAASNNRMNCINTVVSCVQNVCASKWDETTDNYDACLSDPNSIDNYCALEFKRCGDDTAEADVREYVSAKLAALQVDKCTKDVKSCLLSEDRCGPDFAGCVGLDTETIVSLCPKDLLLSCQDRSARGKDGQNESVDDYIERIAQGIALNIDNKLATTCQNALDAAYDRICGEEIDDDSVQTCGALDTEYESLPNLLTSAFHDADNVYATLDQYVQKKGLKVDGTGNTALKTIFDLTAFVRGQDYLMDIKYDETGKGGSTDQQIEGQYFYSSEVNTITKNDNAKQYQKDVAEEMNLLLNEMSNKYSSVIGQLESDTTVDNCMNGRQFYNTKNGKLGKRNNGTETDAGRFPSLTLSVKELIANQLINGVREKYEAVNGTQVNLYQEILDFYRGVGDAELDVINAKKCSAKVESADFSKRAGHKSTRKVFATYVPETNRCVVKTETYRCTDYHEAALPKNRGCRQGKWALSETVEKTEQMDYINENGSVVK